MNTQDKILFFFKLFYPEKETQNIIKEINKNINNRNKNSCDYNKNKVK